VCPTLATIQATFWIVPSVLKSRYPAKICFCRLSQPGVSQGQDAYPELPEQRSLAYEIT
jgi:hypothetical protein